MRHATQCRAIAIACLLGTHSLLYAQSEQVLLDAWVASSDTISDLEFVDNDIGLEERVSGSYSFEAITFLKPDLSVLDPSRDLIAVDDVELIRFDGGTDEARRLNTMTAETGFRELTTVAATDYGTVLFSGYSRRKRRFELWELMNPTAEAGVAFEIAERVPNGSPQLIDSVFIDPADVPGSLTGLLGSTGGLLGVTDRTVLFFPAGAYAEYFALVDVRDLTIKNNTKILSADLARETRFLTIVLSTREILTIDLTKSIPAQKEVALVPIPPPTPPAEGQCTSDRSQLIRIRNVGLIRDEDTDTDTDTSVSVLTDYSCSQILSHTITDEDQPDAGAQLVRENTEGLVAIAVGEGNQIVCLPKDQREGEFCSLTPGYEADFDNSEPSIILSLKFDDLCDPRVPVDEEDQCPAHLMDSIVNGNDLRLNDQLPEDLQLSLAANGVEIIIPDYMYAATGNARFGALFVKADSVTRNLLHTAYVETIDLLGFPGLGVATGFSRGTPLVADGNPFDQNDLINNDIVAFAPDNPDFPTVRGFEATSITTGEGSIKTRPRGYSAVIYGLMHDLTVASGRTEFGGISLEQFEDNLDGKPVTCDPLVAGGQTYDPSSPEKDKEVYFLNLAACQFGDLKNLLTDVIPEQGAMVSFPTESQLLINRLELAEDKLIKTLNAAIPNAGPNSGATTFQSTLEQLDKFEELLLATPFDKQIYKNDLISRLEVFRFTLLERTTPWLQP